jgi:DNA repair protein RecO (recombination protein O)
MHLSTTAIVCATRVHGENGAIARLMTAEAGLLAGYVQGGRSRRVRPILIAGNLVAAEFRARSPDQLASLSVELTHSRAPLLAEPLPAAAIDWVTSLTASALPEGQPYPEIHAALDGLLSAIELSGVARVWAIALVRYELLLLSRLGYGGDLAPTTDLPLALRRNGRALDEHVLLGRQGEGLADVRARLVDRLHRAVAP